MTRNEWISNSGELEAIMSGIEPDDCDPSFSCDAEPRILIEIAVGVECDGREMIGTSKEVSFEQLETLRELFGNEAIDEVIADYQRAKEGDLSRFVYVEQYED